MALVNTVVASTTNGAEFQQSDSEFSVEVNPSLGRHQVGVFTDVTPTAGTASVFYEVYKNVYLPVKEEGVNKVIDLTNPQTFSMDVHTASFKFVLSGFDADKFVGASIYSKNDLS
jgi:hypothetical protein